MLIAFDKNNQRVCASDAEKGDEFYCPYCSSPMLVKKGAIKVPHFAHISATTTCEYDRESKEHMLTKLSIYDWLAEQRVDEVDMEYPLEECRPDIFFVHQGKKVAVEIQLSPIPAAEIILRTQLMNRQGIHVLWLIQSLPIHSEFRARNMWRFLNGWYYGALFSWDNEYSEIIEYGILNVERYNHFTGWTRTLKNTITAWERRRLDLLSDFSLKGRKFTPQFKRYPAAKLYMPKNSITSQPRLPVGAF